MLRVLVAVAVGVASLSLASAASATTKIRPRIGGALGIIPALNAQNVASGGPTAVTYHGGLVMANGITIHTIFWDPSGYPAANESLIK